MFQLCTYAPSKPLVQSMSFLFWRWIMDCIHIFECMYRMGLYIYIHHICYFSFTDNREIVFCSYSISFFTTKTSHRPMSSDRDGWKRLHHPPRPRFDGPRGRVEVKKQQLCGKSRWAPKKKKNEVPYFPLNILVVKNIGILMSWFIIMIIPLFLLGSIKSWSWLFKNGILTNWFMK